MKRALAPLVLVLLFAVAGCHPATAAAPVTLAAEQPSTFMLEPGDVVQVTAWQERDIACGPVSSTSLTPAQENPIALKCEVDERGRLTLPLLGERKVTGIPWERLRDSILADYRRELKNPAISITPLRRVWVLGEVAKPQMVLVDPTVSLAGVVALAGGATPEGDLHRVRVVRNGKTIIESASVESLLLQSIVHSNDQVFVDRRAWVERNGAVVSSLLISTAGILVTLLHR